MKTKVSLLFAFALTFLILFVPASTFAATNDNFASATVINTVPFSDSVDLSSLTDEQAAGEPPNCGFSPYKTAWYTFTPTANGIAQADMQGNSFPANLSVYQAVGPGFGGLSSITCNPYYGNSTLTFNVQAGTTYYFQAGSAFCCYGGNLHFNLQIIVPPANDNFANAAVIGALPFNNTVNTSAASVEAGEPNPSCVNPINSTVWYAFTPTSSASLSAYVGGFYYSALAVYTGSSLANLTQVSCQNYGNRLTFRANAGTTYYFQASGWNGQSGSFTFYLDIAPNPVAAFYFNPSDPSVFDTTQFYGYPSYDPANVGIQTWAWQFGDGASATGSTPTHRYAVDGVYTATLAVTTFDGRNASTSQAILVKTHDVAITKFSAPQSASTGQTRSLSVGINSNRYGEKVQVQLLKSGPAGYELVGTLTQDVPPRSANRTTDFNFSYSFTSADASIGKVTFKAVATLVNARDALPADNEAIASPTKVTK